MFVTVFAKAGQTRARCATGKMGIGHCKNSCKNSCQKLMCFTYVNSMKIFKMAKKPKSLHKVIVLFY